MTNSNVKIIFYKSIYFNELLEIYLRYLDYFNISVERNSFETFIRLLKSKNWNKTILAIYNGKVIGFLTCCKSFSPISLCITFHINDLYVDENIRNKGIGTQMIKKLEEHSKLLGINKLTVNVDKQNEQTLDFYKNRCFQQYDFICHYKIL